MSLEICENYTTGQALVVTIDRPSDGLVWNPDSVAWESAPSFNAAMIALAEDSGQYLRRYRASVIGLGAAGRIRINVHPADGSQCLYSHEVDVAVSNEVTLRNVKLSADGTAAIDIDGKTLVEALMIIAAKVAGLLSGGRSGTESFKGLDGSTLRVTETNDLNGNRTAITYHLP